MRRQVCWTWCGLALDTYRKGKKKKKNPEKFVNLYLLREEEERKRGGGQNFSGLFSGERPRPTSLYFFFALLSEGRKKVRLV